MSDDLISRQAVVDLIMEADPWWFEGKTREILGGIKKLPTIDPVKHGKWIKNEDRYGWHCSVCGEDDLYAFAWNSDKGEKELQDRYCPECGAQIERSEE